MTTVTRSDSECLSGEGAIPDDYIFRLTVEQYHAMIRAGVLVSGSPIELLEGWLLVKRTKNPLHRVATSLIRRALEGVVPQGWFVDSQEPVTTADSEPEPDVAVIRGSVRDYSEHHPGPRDAALVVEVADTSLRRDRVTKKRVYARAGVEIYWVVSLVDSLIEVYSDPTGPAADPDYRQCQTYGRDDQVPVKLSGQEVARLTVSDLLP